MIFQRYAGAVEGRTLIVFFITRLFCVIFIRRDIYITILQSIELGNCISHLTCAKGFIVVILFLTSFTSTSKVVNTEVVAPSTLFTMVSSLVEKMEVRQRRSHCKRWRWSW